MDQAESAVPETQSVEASDVEVSESSEVSAGGAPAELSGSDLPKDGQNLDDKVDELLGAAEGDEEGAEETEDANEEIEEQIKELKKKLKLKVRGKEIEKEIDFNDEEALTRELQKAEAFNSTAQELAAMKKQVGAFIEQLRSNPTAILQEMGYNVDELAENHLKARVEEMNKSPEQIEREKMQKELEQYKKQAEEQKKAAEELKMQKLRDQYANEIDNDISQALETGKTTLPKSPLVVKRIAETMLLAMQNGYDQVKASDVLPIVEKQFKTELQEMFGVLPEDTLEALIGKNNLERIRKKRVTRRKKAPTTAKQVSKDTGKIPEKKAPEAESKKRSKKMSEFFDWRS